jgi:radical SAM protein with 4Fe4S-binding SPASM domain
MDPALLERYLGDILSFADRAIAEARMNVSFRLWNLHPDNTDSFNQFVARRLEQHYRPDFPVLEAVRKPGRNKLRDRLFLNIAQVFDWPLVTAEESGCEGFCRGLRDQIAVLADGTVVPCCLDSGGIIRLGNLFEQELEDILKSERAVTLYEGFSKRRMSEELCRKCGYRSRFSKEER